MQEGSGADEGAAGHSRAAGWVGRLGGPLAALAVWAALPAEPELGAPARAAAGVGTLMAISWMTEALPLAVTSLLPLALFPLFGIADMGAAAAPYANPVVFLFMGGFMIALCMQRWGLHRRIALATIAAAGTSPATLVGGFMLAAAGLSMWISNTATAVMMLPIGLSVIALFDDASPDEPAERERFAVCLLLGLAYACSVGGFATLIGTPPNVILAGFLQDTYGIQIGFGRWMLLGVPLALVLLVFVWLLLTRVLVPVGRVHLPGGRELIRRELRALGATTRPEKLVLAVFLLTALAWIVRDPLSRWDPLVEAVPAVARVSDPMIAMAAAILLFAIPVKPREGVFLLDWETASRLPWGVLLLFGGGLSLAAAVRSTGLDAFIGAQVAVLGAAPEWVLVAGVALLVVLLTELTSNTATATTFLPVLAAVADQLGVDPLKLLVPAALAASCAFMLPVATPPNAIVFGSGRLRVGQMARAGLWLNAASVVLATAAVYTLLPLIQSG